MYTLVMLKRKDTAGNTGSRSQNKPVAGVRCARTIYYIAEMMSTGTTATTYSISASSGCNAMARSRRPVAKYSAMAESHHYLVSEVERTSDTFASGFCPCNTAGPAYCQNNVASGWLMVLGRPTLYQQGETEGCPVKTWFFSAGSKLIVMAISKRIVAGDGALSACVTA